jgi:hypothetical protein
LLNFSRQIRSTAAGSVKPIRFKGRSDLPAEAAFPSQALHGEDFMQQPSNERRCAIAARRRASDPGMSPVTP